MADKMKNQICAVVQATYASNVFPGKSMVNIAGKTVLEHIVFRLRQISFVSEIILATSNSKPDDPLVFEAERLGLKVFRGSEHDVLSRLSEAAEQVCGDTVLKVNGNYPLFDPELARALIDAHLKGGYDFSYNEHLRGTIYGTGCEVIDKKLLLQASKESLTPAQRGAGTLYLHQNEFRYKVNKPDYSNSRPHYKVCFDTEKDLQLIEYILKNLQNTNAANIAELLDNNPILAESNRYESTKEVGIEKLCLFPEKIAALKNTANSICDLSYPISVELSLTNRCNFACLWCSDMDLRARMADDMDLDAIKRLFVDLRKGGTKGIVIEGGGEPAIHKNFKDVVNLAVDLGFGVGLITNGSVAIDKNILDKFEWIRISLDASNPNEQITLKNTDSFDKVMSNIRIFCQSAATVGVGYVVTSKNMGNLESLMLILSNFGVSYIQFRPVIDHPELDIDVDLSYLKRYENSRFSVLTDGMQQNIVEGNDGLPCIAHSLTSVITADGSVYLCGRLNVHSWIEPIGNINEESFSSIWNGQKRCEQSNMVLSSDFCIKYCPRCRLSKFNKLFSHIDRIKTKNFI